MKDFLYTIKSAICNKYHNYDTTIFFFFSCDSLVIITSIFMFSFTVFRHTGTFLFTHYYLHIYPYAVGIVYPIALCCQTGSAYLTLAVTLERYVAVCWSLKARHLCTQASTYFQFDTLRISFYTVKLCSRLFKMNVHCIYIINDKVVSQYYYHRIFEVTNRSV